MDTHVPRSQTSFSIDGHSTPFSTIQPEMSFLPVDLLEKRERKKAATVGEAPDTKLGTSVEIHLIQGHSQKWSQQNKSPSNGGPRRAPVTVGRPIGGKNFLIESQPCRHCRPVFAGAFGQELAR